MKRILSAMMLLSFCMPSQAKDLSIDDVYQSFNLRSINSSYGQRLKHYFQSYLKDYFPTSSITEKTKTKMTLESGLGDRYPWKEQNQGDESDHQSNLSHFN